MFFTPNTVHQKTLSTKWVSRSVYLDWMSFHKGQNSMPALCTDYKLCNTLFTCLFSVIRANIYFPLAPWAGEHPKYCEVTPEDPWGVEDHWTRESLSGRPGTLHLENRFGSSVHHIYVGHRLRDVRNSNAFRNWRMTLTLLYNSLLQHFFTITIFQHFSTMLFSKFLYKNKQKLSSNSSLKSFPPTLLRYTSLQHTFPTHLYLCLLNTLLQHFSTTPFSNSSQ